jgi:hypothetical protein
MGFREDIQKKIEKKQAELAEQERAFERDQAASAAYIQALQDILKGLPREPSEVSADRIFRPGSIMAQTREMILAAKHPLHISEILRQLGKTEKGARASVSGALGAYVRRGEVFVRPKPNTFGLAELGHSNDMESTADVEPPADFGTLKAS